MQMLSWDDKTRPMTRRDLLHFMMDEKNLTKSEKDLLAEAAVFGPSLIAAGAFVGWRLVKFMSWNVMVKKQPHLKPMIPLFKASVIGTFMGFPYLYVQQWTIDRILALDESDSLLAFHVKRFMIIQRNQMMFSRGNMREVSREEQEKLGAASLELRKANAMLGSGGARGSVDVNAALTQQVMTPVAQTGYGGGK